MKTMRVPYAIRWQSEIEELRKLALDCGLSEECKWGKPCFTFLKKNVAIVIPFKDSCALMFFKGALLQDGKHILQKAGENTHAGRWAKFTSVKQIADMQTILRSYLHEAITLETSGRKVERKTPSEHVIPEELQVLLNGDASFKASFDALTPGRRRSYLLHIAGAKQTKTRAARAERCIPMIQSGRGFQERPK